MLSDKQREEILLELLADAKKAGRELTNDELEFMGECREGQAFLEAQILMVMKQDVSVRYDKEQEDFVLDLTEKGRSVCEQMHEAAMKKGREILDH